MLIVPGRPSASGLVWWLKCPAGPTPPRIRIDGPSGSVGPNAVVDVSPSPSLGIYLVAAIGLAPGARYTLTGTDANGNSVAADSRTLPVSIPVGSRFTLALGSCYFLPKDRGVLDSCYPPSTFRTESDPIHLRLLVGDQLYMDLAQTGLPHLSAPDPWAKYEEYWSDAGYASFLRKTPSLFMADDHEFWNDYPHKNVQILFGTAGTPFETTCRQAFETYQAALNIDAGTLVTHQANPAAILGIIGNDCQSFAVAGANVPIYVLDTRSRRTRYDSPTPQFTNPAWLRGALAWIGALDRPGVLVVSQPVVGNRAGFFKRATHTMFDVNLPDYDADFAALWKALSTAPHDVLVLSGDIHWSRFYLARPRGGVDRSVYELISSPLARIPLDGDSPDVDQSGQKVDWQGGSATAYRLFARNGSMIYATASFREVQGPSGPGFDVEASLWAPDPDPNKGARQLATETRPMR